MALSALDENEQIELALKLSKVENTPSRESLNPGLCSRVKPKTIVEAVSYTHLTLPTKLEV